MSTKPPPRMDRRAELGAGIPSLLRPHPAHWPTCPSPTAAEEPHPALPKPTLQPPAHQVAQPAGCVRGGLAQGKGGTDKRESPSGAPQPQKSQRGLLRKRPKGAGKGPGTDVKPLHSLTSPARKQGAHQLSGLWLLSWLPAGGRTWAGAREHHQHPLPPRNKGRLRSAQGP